MLTVYKASAGSGKTYTLTKTYLRLLLGIKQSDGRYRLNHSDFGNPLGNRHRRILAITFTNKATEEMKSRIVSQLDILANPETAAESDYVKDFTREFGCSVTQLSEAAAKAMNQLLTGYSDFYVTTIDSFFQTVLRAMAFELDYPGDYEVVLESDAVVSEAVSMMLDDFNCSPDTSDNNPVAKALLDFMREQRDNGGKFNIFNRRGGIFSKMVSSAMALFDEKYHILADDFEKWLNNPDSVPDLSKNLKDWEEKLLDKNRKLAKKFMDALTAKSFKYSEVTQAFAKRIEEAASGEVPQTDVFTQVGFTNIYHDRDYLPKSLFKSKTRGQKECTTDFVRDMTVIFRQIARNAARIYDIRTIAGSISIYRFMKVLTDNIHRFSNDRNIVVLADTNRVLNGVMDKGNVPFVYEKIGNSLYHFLIDEFQDTSRLQWQNLLPLVENGLAEGNDSLIIGDEKQSIYRFRNSDSSLLHTEVSRHFGTAVDLHGHHAGENTNWRSSGVIVRFNNALFSALAELNGVEGYDNVCQDIAPSHADEDGYIRFFPFSKTVSATDACETDTLVAEIKRQHKAGYAWSDIAVLVGTRTKCQEYAQALLANGIPIATEEALLLRNNPSVALIVSTLKMFLDAKADVPMNRKNMDRRTFCSQFQFFYNRGLQSGEDPDASAVNAINHIFYGDNSETVAGAVADLVEENPSSLSELIEIVILKRISEQERIRDMAFLGAFQDAAIQYSATFGNNLVEFMRWWNSVSPNLSVATPDNNDAVRVMTIHKAKGLEFACVHLPYAEYPLTSKRKVEKEWLSVPRRGILKLLPPALNIEYRKETEIPLSMFCSRARANARARVTDGLNRVYVAYTRPSRELCVYYKPEVDLGKTLAEVLAGFDGFDSTDMSFIIGAPTRPLPVSQKKQEQQRKQREALFSLDSYDIVDIHRKKVLSEIDYGLPTNPTGVEYDDDVRHRAAVRGTAMHFAMSCLNARNVPMEVAMERAIKRARRRGLTPDDEQVLRSLVTAPQTAGALRKWFVESKRSIAEAPLTSADPANPGVFDTGDTGVLRPDLIVWHDDDNIEIVDFKFTTEAQRGHMEQVRDYVARMRLVYPQATFTATLLYADLLQTVPVQL